MGWLLKKGRWKVRVRKYEQTLRTALTKIKRLRIRRIKVNDSRIKNKRIKNEVWKRKINKIARTWLINKRLKIKVIRNESLGNKRKSKKWRIKRKRNVIDLIREITITKIIGVGKRREFF